MGTTERPADMAPLTRQVGEEAKSEQDRTDLSRRFKNMAVEAALGTQIDEHLGCGEHASKGCSNGPSSRTLQGASGGSHRLDS